MIFHLKFGFFSFIFDAFFIVFILFLKFGFLIYFFS